jgi:RimJ/RimL family protein N-acetyltransferase
MNKHTGKELSGKFVDLELLEENHREELRTIACDENIWTYVPHKVTATNFDSWYEKIFSQIQLGEHCPYVVKRKTDQKIVGSTRYYNIDFAHRRLAIGFTWYIKEAQGCAINPESKLLLLKQAFEQWEMNRVEFMTDSRNLRSQAAIKKLGASQEGILRQHMVLEDGYVRDSVIFSVTKSDWPLVKHNLQERLSKF